MVLRFHTSPIPFPSMGVITSNRKRSEECMNLNETNNSSSPIHNSSSYKKPKFSSSTPTQPLSSSNSTLVSRISRYPEATIPLVREVHAPCRPRKFDFLTKPRRESSFEGRVGGDFRSNIDMGNFYSRKYEKAKREAVASIRSLPKGKEVIDLDTPKGKEVIDLDNDSHRYKVSEDSSIEEEVRVVKDDDIVEIYDLDPMVVDDGIQQKSISAVDSELTDSNLKTIVRAEKKWDALDLSHQHDFSSVHVYKKLLESVRGRDTTIERLKFEIELHEKRKDALALLGPKKEPMEVVEEVPQEPFIPLMQEEINEVENAFSANRRRILVTHENSNIEISTEKLQCLRPGVWLNDEVINLYLELLKEREKREPKKFLKCHFFNTFFYKKLRSGRSGYDFKSVRRWTSQKKLGYGLVECDKIFVPIHKEIHWCLAVINKKDEKFQYLDSLKGMDNHVLKVLARYYADEVKDKTGKDIDVSSWEKEFVEDLPEQENGFDCGVFMIKYADFYSRGLRLCFKQENMPYFRLRTAKEILRLKAD
ncbi:PREDICTED: ubiquitin-like-specific protease ESD4 isoform X1 [Lupinus angustifolius]|uniref:ubiquitin-like-specific protease ESD4 isoform X1 n=1 Tax=Lupinus angustifolius TaxID=3871 RepID=UPI00092F31E2|nr:PREDICTED: ubiquitin-like-specific protease ESD4 isoform X1 [Lupinus angustifolius]